MKVSNRIAHATAGAAIVWGSLAVMGGRAIAQSAEPPAVLLALDKDALDYGPAPHLLPANAVNPQIVGVGVRDELSYFQSHLHAQVILTSGQNGSDGWFALRTVPASWASEPGGTDGPENYALAGPGLGSPDDTGERESLLDNVSDVTPLHADGLALLVGRTVCAVVYAHDIIVIPSSPTMASLKGATFGSIAFKVVALLPTDNPNAPNVQVEISEGHEVCSGQLVGLSEAP